jgi:viroplasmin and RNaseH domain-containing protein
MSDSKIQIKVGIVEFSGEGNQDWLASQLDKILAKVPELLKIELSNPTAKPASLGKGGTPESIPKANKLNSNLATYLKDKSATTNQVKKFLATSVFLQLNGKNRLNTSDVSDALKNANQAKLNNPSECLNQNVKKGHCEKDGSKEFFVTTNGLKELGIEE